MNLTQHVTEPTHFTSTSETLLDLICTDADVCRVGVDHIPTLSAHSLVYCELNLPKIKPLFKSFSHRPLTHIDALELASNFAMVDWEIMFRMRNIDDAVNLFNTNVLDIFDLLAPIKHARIKKNHHL